MRKKPNTTGLVRNAKLTETAHEIIRENLARRNGRPKKIMKEILPTRPRGNSSNKAVIGTRKDFKDDVPNDELELEQLAFTDDELAIDNFDDEFYGEDKPMTVRVVKKRAPARKASPKPPAKELEQPLSISSLKKVTFRQNRDKLFGEQNTIAAIERITESALGGDLASCKFIVDKKIPNATPRKGAPIEFALANMTLESFKDLDEASKTIMRMMFEGNLTIEEAHAAQETLKQRKLFMETISYDKDIEELMLKQQELEKRCIDMAEREKKLIGMVDRSNIRKVLDL